MQRVFPYLVIETSCGAVIIGNIGYLSIKLIVEDEKDFIFEKPYCAINKESDGA